MLLNIDENWHVLQFNTIVIIVKIVTIQVAFFAGKQILQLEGGKDFSVCLLRTDPDAVLSPEDGDSPVGIHRISSHTLWRFTLKMLSSIQLGYHLLLNVF